VEQFYHPHALADGNYCIHIRDKLLVSSTVLSAPSLHSTFCSVLIVQRGCRGCSNPVISTYKSYKCGYWCQCKSGGVVDKFCNLGDMLSVDGDADAAVKARIRIGWNNFRQLVPLLTNRDISLIRRGRLYSSCMRSSMLHGSET